MVNKKTAFHAVTIYLHGSSMLENVFANQTNYKKIPIESCVFDTQTHEIFTNKLKNQNSDYIVIDFLNTINTSFSDTNNEELFKKHIDQYSDLLLQKFNPNKIILLRTTIPYMRANYGIVKPCYFDFDEQRFRRITKLENYLIEKINPYQIDIAKYYFLDRFRKLVDGNVRYEHLFYLEIDNIISKIVESQPEQRIFDTPNYEYTLQRYVAYYDNIHAKNMASDFFDSADVVGQIILNMSKETIVSNLSDLLALKKSNLTSYDAVLHYDFKDNKMLESIVFAVVHILKQDITNPQIDFSIVYRENLEAKKPLAKQVGEQLKQLKLAHIDVNKHNVETYHKILTLYKNRQYKKVVALLLDSYDNLAKPILMDDWGSCISRVPFNCDKTGRYKVNHFICRCCCLDEFDEPADISDIDFFDVDPSGGRWFNKCFKNSLEKTSKEKIIESPAKWIVIDFFDMINELAIYRNAIIDFSEDNRNTTFMKIAQKDCVPFIYYDKPDEQIKDRMDQFIAFIKNKYGDNIILVNLFVEKYYLDGKRRIKPLHTKDADTRNQFINKWQDYFYQQTSCYCIDIAKNFLADDLTVFGTSMVHYEEAFNKEVFRYIDTIIQKQPKERLINDYSNSVKIERLIELKSNNDDISIIKSLFENSEYDAYLFGLSIEELEELQAKHIAE